MIKKIIRMFALLTVLGLIIAPISLRGFIIRFIGLFSRDLSPIKFAEIPWPDNKPESNLILVPEFRQSSVIFGDFKCFPLMINVLLFSLLSKPQASKHLRVVSTSSPVDKL